MIGDQPLPVSLMVLLVVFESCFTVPTFRKFSAMVAGSGPRTVCSMLTWPSRPGYVRVAW